ncbi:DUF45 domain-containing protein [Halobacillus seohaensis]|uniref:DUF45 domain-containing protein n=1 Tax=Halobacillus seohaensis TaxID=447421 RepID=A0ABW2EJJ0_9BACI
MPLLNYGTTDIHYIHYPQNRKDIKISVDLVNGIEVYSPENLEDAKVNELIKKKSPWIITKLREDWYFSFETPKQRRSPRHI